jgi:3-oxoacid CoA-transferase subunit A
VAEVEYLVEPGEIDPDTIVTPGIYVHRIVPVAHVAKRIEKRTTRPRPA